MKRILIFTIATAHFFSLHAMQPKTYFERLPADITSLIIPFLIGENLDQAIANMQKFYAVHPESARSPEAFKIFLNHILSGKFGLNLGKKLQAVVDQFKNLEALNDPELKKWIRNQKRRLGDPIEEKELLSASQKFEVTKIKSLLAQDINPNIKNDKDLSVLSIVMSNANRPENPKLIDSFLRMKNEIVTLLISVGAEVNARDRDGFTPLHLAVSVEGFSDIVANLLKHGANPNAITDKGITPLDSLANALRISLNPKFLQDYKKTLALLLNAGADPNRAQKKIRTDIENSKLSLQEKNELIESLRKKGFKD